jgi:nucleotidyltransferase substrate binding protein (TIGR01987 family)
MERLRERVRIARTALGTLDELADLPAPTKVERDAAIQRFEYTFEAIWKAAERYLRVIDGIGAGSPKACVRAARSVGLLDDEHAVTALEMVDHRNLTVHTYDESLANEIYAKLALYARLLREWLDAMASRLD